MFTMVLEDVVWIAGTIIDKALFMDGGKRPPAAS